MRLRPAIALPTICAVVAVSLTSWTTASPGQARVDPGRLPQTATLPSSANWRFRGRMAALWRGIVRDSLPTALPAFFPQAAYIQVKQLPDAAADYRDGLLANFRADIHAAHLLVIRGGRTPRLVAVRVPREWSWIQPGYCYNKVGY